MNRKRYAKLHQIYRTIPKNECTGECVQNDICAEIGGTQGEFDQLEKVSGKKPKLTRGKCNYLKKGKCSVYEDRPAVCRLWGVTETMRCPHCKADRVLTVKEGYAVLKKVRQLFNEGEPVYND